MEIRARYLTIGLFTLGVIAAGFLFVFWMFNSGGFGRRDAYKVRFAGSVSGLFTGSPVTFNGLRVGEVTGLELDAADPAQVLVSVGVQPGTPIRVDTNAALDFQGLTGAAAVALSGGSAGARPLALTDGQAPMLIANADASQSMTQSARTVMRKLDVVLNENSEPLKGVIGNLNTFTGALARNSDRIDGILSGLERMAGGAGKKPAATAINLSAPQSFGQLPSLPKVQIAVPEPTALGALDTDKIVLDPAAPPEAAAQWADALPKLVQARFVQAFENAGLVGSVLRGGDAVAADYQLQTDLRRFRTSSDAASLVAEFELTAKIVNAKGRIIAGQIFKASVPLSANDPKVAAGGLDEAFGAATRELVVWTAGVIAAQPPPKADDAATLPPAP